MGIIYSITNLKNEKVYIGKTSRNFQTRKNEHLKDMFNLDKDNKLYRAMRKYGIENFSFKIIEECSDTILDEREKFYIQKFNSYVDGYNSTLGGDGSLLYDYDKIVELYQKGYSQKQISQELNCSRKTVYSALKVNENFIVKRKRTDIGPGRYFSIDEKEKLFSLRNEGKSIKEISAITGHAESTISKILKTNINFKDYRSVNHYTKKIVFEGITYNSISELANYLINNVPKFYNKKLNTVISGISYSANNNKTYCGYQFYYTLN